MIKISFTENELMQIGSALSANTDWPNDDFAAYMRNRFTGHYGKGPAVMALGAGEAQHIINALLPLESQSVVGATFKKTAEKIRAA